MSPTGNNCHLFPVSLLGLISLFLLCSYLGIISIGLDTKYVVFGLMLMVTETKQLGNNQGVTTLTGKTLEVYTLLMELKEWVGVREVQRILGYSSPNLAFYHLNKLYEIDLVNKSDDNKYSISQKGLAKKLGPFQDRVSVMGNWVSDFYILFLTFAILSLLTISFLILQISYIIWFLIYFPLSISLTYFYWIRARSLDQLPSRLNGTDQE